MSETRFPLGGDCMDEPAASPQPDPGPLPAPRLRRTNRQQMIMRPLSLDELLRRDHYRWICGGVSVNDHTLSDFRVQHEAALDDLLTQMLTVLIHNQEEPAPGLDD